MVRDRMSNKKHNILVAPLVILVRVPVLTTLLIIAIIGRGAEKLYDVVDERVPGFRR